MPNVGDRVRLNLPENPRLHGAVCVVREVTPWGARVTTTAAATGWFRALASEMVSVGVPARQQGYTGNCCPRCGSARMLRAGSCECCQECGETSGCG